MANAMQLEINDLNLQTVTNRVPPSWCPEKDKQYPLRVFLQDLRLWQVGTDMDVARQGPSVAQRLAGSAKELARELDATALSVGVNRLDNNGNLMHVPGMQLLIDALNRRYGALAQELEVFSINEFFTFRRMSGETFDALLTRFELMRGRALANANFDMTVCGIAWYLLTITGYPRSQWTLLLAPTLGALPNTQPQYDAMIAYIRRQSHMTEKGASTDIMKNMPAFFTDTPVQQPSYSVAADGWADSPQPDWSMPQPSQAAYWSADGNIDSDILSSGNSNDDEVVDLTDMRGLDANDAGCNLYLAYRHSKRRWRRFSGKGSRKGKGKGSKGGKGKGKKGHSKKAFMTLDDAPAYVEVPPMFDEWSAYDENWNYLPSSDESWQYFGGKGSKGSATRRGNPIGRDGKQLLCTLCKSPDHFQRFCPQASSSSSSGKGHAFAAVTGVS